MGEELKPCPFCGSKLRHMGNYAAHPENRCYLSGDAIDYREFDRWNTRTPDPRLSRMREALEEARGVIRVDRDSLFECCTVGPKHDPSTLEDGAAAAVADYDRTLAKIDSILEELKEG